MEIDQNLISNVLIVVAAVVLMKFLPRLLAFGIPFVDVTDLNAKLVRGEDIVVLDVRTEGEFMSDTGHVAGALNLPMADVRNRLKAVGGDLDAFKAHPVFVMCRTENRSTNVAKMMKRAGFNNIAVVKGGIKAWNKAGLPVESAA